MKILYITQTFPPEPGSTQRPLKQAVCLHDLGHEITILTTMPYYPLGRIFKQYRGKVLIREKLEGIDVIRVWSVPAPNKGKIRRIISQVSFAIGAVITALWIAKPDLIIASVPPIGAEIAAVFVASLKRCWVLLELRDVIPDNLLLIGINRKSPLARILDAYFKLIYRWVDLIAVPGKNMIDTLKQRGVSSNRILLLPHAGDLEQLVHHDGQQVRQRFGLQDKFVVVYAGSFSRYYCVPHLVAAASYLQDKLRNVQLLLVGTGPDREKVGDIIRKTGQKNVTLAGSVAPDEIGAYLQAADLFLAPWVAEEPLSCYQDYLGTKVCEYLVVGRPVVALENYPVYGNLLRRIGAGTSVTARHPEKLADAIAFYATNRSEAIRCGNNARAYALTHLERKSVVKKFESELVKKLRDLEMKSR